MFTGLVEAIGSVRSAARTVDGNAIEFWVDASALAPAGLALGESIAHDGVCLTVTARDAAGFVVLAGAETLARTTLGAWVVGRRINLERALPLGARLGGHLVAGHVDGVGRLVGRDDRGTNLVMRVELPLELAPYIIVKGSITLDGVSLTINALSPPAAPVAWVEVALIPHTVAHTTLGDRALGDGLNVEVDLIAKYVERQTAAHRSPTGESP